MTQQCDYHARYAGKPLNFKEPQPVRCEICARAEEKNFRKGYHHGYAAAMDDWRELTKRGYVRSSEIWNILARFFDEALHRWCYASHKGEPVPPPDAAYPDDWSEIRKRVIERDGGKCVVCEATQRLEVDHMKPVSEGGLPDDGNLRTLCARCHAERRRK